MPEARKILGQGSPAAGGTTDLITVPASREQVVSTVAVCNTGAAATTFRLHARIAGSAVAAGNAVCYDVPIGAKETVTLTLGVTLAATDKLTAQAAAAGVTFTAFGVEIS